MGWNVDAAVTSVFIVLFNATNSSVFLPYFSDLPRDIESVFVYF
jgi:hypothetical protein